MNNNRTAVLAIVLVSDLMIELDISIVITALPCGHAAAKIKWIEP